MTSVKTSKRPVHILPKQYPYCLPALGNTGLVCCKCQSPSAFNVLSVCYRCFSPVIRKATFLEIPYQCDLWRPVFSIEGVISLIEEGYQPFLQVGFACWAQHENSLLHCGGSALCHQQTMGHVTGTMSKNHAHNALRQPYTSKWDLLKCVIVFFPFCSAALELP